jgi:excisionase family DNA binding protein
MREDEEHVLLTVKEAAAIARRSRSQIYAKLKAGELPAVRSLGGVLIHKARFLDLLEREAALAAPEQGAPSPVPTEA